MLLFMEQWIFHRLSQVLSSNNNTIIYDNYIILTRRDDVMKYEYLMVEKLMSSILAISTLSFDIFSKCFDLLKMK